MGIPHPGNQNESIPCHRQLRRPQAEAAEAAVREKALSTIGSKHKLKRWQIDITSVEEIPADQVVNHVVKYQIGE